MPRLTEQEQQEIIRYIEEDKPLPDKYRFLLFADKREVELVWNGKTSDVSTIVLPFQIIEQIDEPRSEDLFVKGDKRSKGKTVTSTRQMDMFGMDNRGRQLGGWTNKLILSSLPTAPCGRTSKTRGALS